MKSRMANRQAGRIYLILVPVLVIAFGFGVGKISSAIYLPVWIINIFLMVMASWALGLHVVKQEDESRFPVTGAFFLIVPMIIISMFFGLGPPPETAAGWVATAAEQQIRYSMLTVAGVFIALGFAILKEKLFSEGEKLFSLIGYVTIIIAIPLFLLDMLFWGFSLTESFKILISTHTEKLPDWFNPIRSLFGMISVVEVALTYLAIAFFAVSMNQVGWLSKPSSRIYIIISLLCFIIIVLSAFLNEPFITAGFAVSIPAIPFLMPYYMGINILKQAGDSQIKHIASGV